MKFRLLFSLWLACALLFAQQGAALHALSHLAEGVPGAPAQSQQEKHLPHSLTCDQCIAYAGIGSAAVSSPLAFDGSNAVAILAATVFFLIFASPLRAYRSRAPPHRQ